MKIYFYTENSTTQNFVVKFWDGSTLSDVPPSEVSQCLFRFSHCECTSDLDENGVCASAQFTAGDVKTALSFKFLVNERSPSGRMRVVFGCTEYAIFSFQLKEPMQSVSAGASRFLLDLGLSVPQGRLEHLQKTLELTYEKSNRKGWWSNET